MRNLILIICLTVIGIIRCTEKESTNLVIKKDSLGRIVSEIHYLNDTLKHGLARYYYGNGDIRDEVEYAYNNREGWHKHYKPGKILENKIQFKDGLQHGQCYWYHDNGKVRSSSYWVRDKEYCPTYLYYPNEQVEMYRCKDFFGNILYIIKWDEKGNKIKEEGVVFSPEFYVSDLDSTNALRANQEVIIQITVAEPPETKATIWMGEITSDGEVENFRELSIENNTAIYKHKFTEAGKYSLITVGEIKDKSGIVLKKDSVTTDIVVK